MEELAKIMLGELQHNLRRAFIIILILIFALVGSNGAWLYITSLPDDEVTESYELDGSDDANVFYNGEGQVQIGQ